jgi:hypothetical protein
LNEIIDVLKKAAVGRGLPVGLAEDAAQAGAWLIGQGHDGVSAVLMAIEEEDHSVFQARVYMKGYLRQLCRLLHLPAREVPQRFVEQVGIE